MPKVEIPAEEVFSVLKENILVDGFHVVIDLEKSHGAVIVDALEGKVGPGAGAIEKELDGVHGASPLSGRSIVDTPRQSTFDK